MSDNDFEPYKVPVLGKTIARMFVTCCAVFKKDWLISFSIRVTNEPRQGYLNYLVWYVVLIAPFWASGIVVVSLALSDLFGDHFQITGPNGINVDADDLRWRYVSITALLAALGALFAVPFSLVRVYLNERQARTAEEGLITDRITKAIAQLGIEKVVKSTDNGEVFEKTEPNLEVRLGAIYALERIAQDSERDHVAIMETLSAYIRHNSLQREILFHHVGDYPEEPESVDSTTSTERTEILEKRSAELTKWIEDFHTNAGLREDVRAALTVISRRSERQIEIELGQNPPFRINLSGCNFQMANLSGLKFINIDACGVSFEGSILRDIVAQNCNFSRSDYTGVDLMGSNISGSHFIKCIFEWSRLDESLLINCDFEESIMFKCVMHGSEFHSCSFNGVIMEHSSAYSAVFENVTFENGILDYTKFWGARLSESKIVPYSMNSTFFGDATIVNSKMNSYYMQEINLSGTRMKGINCRGADLSTSIGFEQSQANHLFGDANTQLPDSVIRTTEVNHAPLESYLDNDTEFERWKAAGCPSGQPLEET